MEYLVNVGVGTTAADCAPGVYDLVCRYGFDQPGFALLHQHNVTTSLELRREMVALKEELSSIHLSKSGMGLGWFTMGRFDQKNTTKLHRDGGPSESLLILGYEPTEVEAEVSMADYSACAHALCLTPDMFLEQFNPMYEHGLDKLSPYITVLESFDIKAFQILVVNNSSCPHDSTNPQWQGVLHGARMLSYEESQPRIINSTSVAPQRPGEPDFVECDRQLHFVNDLSNPVSNYT